MVRDLEFTGSTLSQNDFSFSIHLVTLVFLCDYMSLQAKLVIMCYNINDL